MVQFDNAKANAEFTKLVKISFLADITMGAYFSWKSQADHNWKEWAQAWDESLDKQWILANYPEFGPSVADAADDVFMSEPDMSRLDLIKWIADYLEYGPDIEPPTFDEALYSSLYVTPYSNV